jgi:hypothetical protein
LNRRARHSARAARVTGGEARHRSNQSALGLHTVPPPEAHSGHDRARSFHALTTDRAVDEDFKATT